MASEAVVAAAGCLPLSKNLRPSACMFCFLRLPAHQGIRLQECGHVFCRGCLEFAVKMQKESMEIPCLVWYFKNCEGFLKDTEVRQLVSPEMYQEYIDRSLVVAKKKMKNVFSCKTEGCGGWCEFETGRRTFVCPVCNQINCVECNTIHVYGDSCDMYKKSVSCCGQELGDRGRVSVSLVKKEKVTGWGQLVQLVKSSGNSFQIEQTDLLLNTSDFECSICFSDTSPGQGVILHECLHMFCRQCLIRLVDLSEDPSVKCPYIDALNQNCCCLLQPREIKALVPRHIYDKHLQRSMTLGETTTSENTFHCKTPDCSGWCFYDDGVTRFICSICRRRNCIPCQAIHDNMSCADYRKHAKQNHSDRLSEATVEMLIRQGHYMRCPTCKIPVQKVAGCDWLQCSLCKTEICWVTRGPRWGPLGKGDTSGGCRCSWTRRCHSQCTGCH